jgi:acetyl-CoA C-acetyltransferase
MANAYIIDAVRTPRGRSKKGSLTGIHPQELLAQTLKQIVERNGIENGKVDDVIIGCVTQIGEQAANIARNALLLADYPISVTGVTLNRFCGSGLQAVNFAAMSVMSGSEQFVIGGGVESMSRVPMGADDPEVDGGNPNLQARHPSIPQGVSADLIATLEGFSRREVDQFALRSQQRAARAYENGSFSRSLFAVRDPQSGEIVLERDEHLRPATSLDALMALPAAFEAVGNSPSGPNGETPDQLAIQRYPQARNVNHVHTAGNSSGIVDGAAAVAIASEDFVKSAGLRPRARIISMATAGADPLIMLTAPALASQKALSRAGMRPRDIDLWEINEAFAVVPLQTIRSLNLDPEKINVNGGAIALGHPLGATGAILIGTALDELERRELNTAAITLCIRGGQGITTIIERV